MTGYDDDKVGYGKFCEILEVSRADGNFGRNSATTWARPHANEVFLEKEDSGRDARKEKS